MTKINCSAKTCVYNQNGGCHSGSIKIHENSEKNINCTSFIHVHKNVKSNIESECEHIVCNADDCVHNKNLECSCSNVYVTGNDAINFEETKCCSFISK